MRLWAPIAVVILGLAAPASAGEFDDMVAGARRMPSAHGLGALFWSGVASCNQKSDYEKRQCLAVRAARKGAVSAEVYLVTGDEVLDIGDYDAKKKSIEVTVRSCLYCGKGKRHGKGKDRPVVVVGNGNHKVGKGGIVAAPVSEHAMTFDDKGSAEHWRKYVGGRLVTDFLVKIPANAASWSGGRYKGYRATVVGYRVYDPCEGKVLWSKPESTQAPSNASNCGKVPDKPDKADKPAAETVVEGPQDPERLTTAQINDAMKAARDAADKCFDGYGIAGTASFQITISNEGKIVDLKHEGDFVGTPTGDCVEKAVRAATFPKTKKKATTVTYPIILN